ncbi:MAG: GntR family transcriptional regulator [Moorellales bacterium]
MGKLQPIEVESVRPLRELVFEALRDAIVNGTLAPGERLMEVQLAEELGVSRTPVREAIRRLELEGYVVTVPRKGAYVAGISAKDVAEVFEIRAALEGLAAELAAERITEEELEELERRLHRVAVCVEEGDLEALVEADTQFHEVLYRASRNRRLSQIIGHLREQIQRFRASSLATPGRRYETLEEHKKIVEALAKRNAALARRLAEQHIENAENRLFQYPSGGPDR